MALQGVLQRGSQFFINICNTATCIGFAKPFSGQMSRLTSPWGSGIVTAALGLLKCIGHHFVLNGCFSRGALPEVDRSHPSGSLFLRGSLATLLPDHR